jgi:hypothetical protein
VLVVVLAVHRVSAPVVHIVDVVAVRDRDVTASLAVHMIVWLVHRVAGRLAFVVVIIVPPMDVTIVHVVDVIPVWDRDVTASLAMCVAVLGVLFVDCLRHFTAPVADVLVLLLARRSFSLTS